jgi:predicted ATPase
MIRSAAAGAQVVVVTHSADMRDQLDTDNTSALELYKELGETRVEGQTMLTAPPWDWGKR